MSDNVEVLVAIAKLEGKLDRALRATSDHESRLRRVEAQPIPDVETDKRLDALEGRRTISPIQLWSGITGVAGFAVTILLIGEKFPWLNA